MCTPAARSRCRRARRASPLAGVSPQRAVDPVANDRSAGSCWIRGSDVGRVVPPILGVPSDTDQAPNTRDPEVRMVGRHRSSSMVPRRRIPSLRVPPSPLFATLAVYPSSGLAKSFIRTRSWGLVSTGVGRAGSCLTRRPEGRRCRHRHPPRVVLFAPRPREAGVRRVPCGRYVTLEWRTTVPQARPFARDFRPDTAGVPSGGRDVVEPSTSVVAPTVVSAGRRRAGRPLFAAPRGAERAGRDASTIRVVGRSPDTFARHRTRRSDACSGGLDR